MFNTIVTSDLGDRVCSEYGIDVEKTLTGFKYIGNKIHEHELLGDKTFVFGYEESYGCLVADFVRDKDAVQASLMLCEAAAYYNEKGMSLLDALDNLYEKHGFFLDALDSFMFKGFDGADKMKKLVDDLRNDPPTEAAGNKVVVFEDFMSDAMLAKGFEKTNALRFTLEDGSWVAVRPSGTEPKCKFYFTVVAKDKKEAEEKLLKIKPVFERI
jgi:phosphoglucomutase